MSKVKHIEIQFPFAVPVPQDFYDKLDILLKPIADAHKEQWGQLEYYTKVLGDIVKNVVSKIEVTFPTSVTLSSEVQRGIDDLLQPICDKHVQENPDRVMWVFGHGSKPLWREPEEPEWDDEVFMIEIAERKAHPKELKRKEHRHVCEKCGGSVDVIPESQASAILRCRVPSCKHEKVILF